MNECLPSSDCQCMCGQYEQIGWFWRGKSVAHKEDPATWRHCDEYDDSDFIECIPAWVAVRSPEPRGENR